MKMNHDLHVHTFLSACCQDENHVPINILALAAEMGVATIGFADHIWANPAIPCSDWYKPQDETQISRLREQLAEISSPVRVLVGCEAEMAAPGNIGITPEFASQLDYVLLACNHFHMKEFIEQPADTTPDAIADHVLKFFISGVRSGLATSIAHPFLPFGLSGLDTMAAVISDGQFTDALGVAAENNVAIEITTIYVPKENEFSIETPIRFLSLAKQAGCKFTFGTDAHSPDRQRKLPQLAPLVQAIGLTEDDIIPLVR